MRPFPALLAYLALLSPAAADTIVDISIPPLTDVKLDVIGPVDVTALPGDITVTFDPSVLTMLFDPALDFTVTVNEVPVVVVPAPVAGTGSVALMALAMLALLRWRRAKTA
jgi:hypothetical protein